MEPASALLFAALLTTSADSRLVGSWQVVRLQSGGTSVPAHGRLVMRVLLDSTQDSLMISLNGFNDHVRHYRVLGNALVDPCVPLCTSTLLGSEITREDIDVPETPGTSARSAAPARPADPARLAAIHEEDSVSSALTRSALWRTDRGHLWLTFADPTLEVELIQLPPP